MSVLVQISDTHFGTEQQPVVEALLEFVRATQPDIAVLSGDLTQRARRTQFRAAREFRDQLHARTVIALPGNHDIPLFNVPARVFFPYAGYRRAFGHELEPRCESSEFQVIGVNTTRPYRRVDGEVSPQQIERVARELRESSDARIRIVVTHQPVHVIKQKDEKNLLHGHEAAIRAWAAAGADIIMGGHIHLPYIRCLTERFADLPRRVWAVQAGTGVSARVRHSAPNSVNLIRKLALHAPACAVERWDYDAQARRFVLFESQQLELDRTS